MASHSDTEHRNYFTLISHETGRIKWVLVRGALRGNLTLNRQLTLANFWFVIGYCEAKR